MGNNFRKIMVLYEGSYYQVDRKPEFHQAACKHEFIKGQQIKDIGQLNATMIAEEKDALQRMGRLAKTIGKKPIGRLPKKANICIKCGKIKSSRR